MKKENIKNKPLKVVVVNPPSKEKAKQMIEEINKKFAKLYGRSEKM